MTDALTTSPLQLYCFVVSEAGSQVAQAGHQLTISLIEDDLECLILPPPPKCYDRCDPQCPVYAVLGIELGLHVC